MRIHGRVICRRRASRQMRINDEGGRKAKKHAPQTNSQQVISARSQSGSPEATVPGVIIQLETKELCLSDARTHWLRASPGT